MEGIKYLHQFEPQIVHRDIKSLNLLVTDSNSIKVPPLHLHSSSPPFYRGLCLPPASFVPPLLPPCLHSYNATIINFPSDQTVFRSPILVYPASYKRKLHQAHSASTSPLLPLPHSLPRLISDAHPLPTFRPDPFSSPRTTRLRGTYCYTAPEVYFRKNYTVKSDGAL